jgi:hypothetical protein
MIWNRDFLKQPQVYKQLANDLRKKACKILRRLNHALG